MRYKTFKLDLFLCEVSILLVSVCLLFLSLVMISNIYIAATGESANAGNRNRYLINTTIKTVELCKYDIHFCTNIR